MNSFIGFILAAGEGTRSFVEGISLHKGNYPLPDGTTPISRIITQLARGGVGNIFIVIKQTTPDFKNLRRTISKIAVELINDCDGETYPTLSLSKAFSKLTLPPETTCCVCMCDVLFGKNIHNLITYPLSDKEMALGWHQNKFIGCIKASYNTLHALCRNTKLAKIDDVITRHEGLGGSISKVEVRGIHIGSLEEYTRYIISKLASTNPHLKSL